MRGHCAADWPKSAQVLVHDVDRSVDDDHTAEGDAVYLEGAREDIEGVVDDGVALEAVCG